MFKNLSITYLLLCSFAVTLHAADAPEISSVTSFEETIANQYNTPASSNTVSRNNNNGKELKFGFIIPNLKISNSIGLAIDDGDFNFFSHGDDGDMIIDKPSILLSYEGKFDISLITGSQKKNFNFQTSNAGDFDFLDLIPVDGTASPGEIVDDSGLQTIVTESNLSLYSFNQLWDVSELNLNKNNFLQQLDTQFVTKIGFRSNISHYSSEWEYKNSPYTHTSNESVDVISVGPMLSIESYGEPLNENTNVYYKADISALLSKESMRANQFYDHAFQSKNYHADDDRVTVAGMINLAVGMNNQLNSGGVLSLSGSVNVRNDLPSIIKPICTTGMDCDSPAYAAQANAAHLGTEITVSPSVNLSLIYDF